MVIYSRKEGYLDFKEKVQFAFEKTYINQVTHSNVNEILNGCNIYKIFKIGLKD